jgi:hypothetical protein
MKFSRDFLDWAYWLGITLLFWWGVDAISYEGDALRQRMWEDLALLPPMFSIVAVPGRIIGNWLVKKSRLT